MTRELEILSDAWPRVRETLGVPHTEEAYRRTRSLLDRVTDEVGENEDHPWASLMETLGSLVDSYEREYTPEPSGNPIAALAYLMDEHGLTQSSLPEVGSQGVVSEVLRGRRQLNIRQVRALGRRFGVSPAVFI